MPEPLHDPNIPAAIANSATLFFKKLDPGLEFRETKVVAEILAAEAVKYESATRKQHLKAIACAYALYVHCATGGDDARFALSEDLKINFRSVRKNFDSLRFFIEALVNYDGEQMKRPTRSAEWLYARDARAIRYLMSVGIGPDALVERGANRGEGLHSWASKANQQKPNEEAAHQTRGNIAPDDGYELRLIHKGKEKTVVTIPPSGGGFLDHILGICAAYGNKASSR